MEEAPIKKISAIIPSERRLEKVVAELKTLVAHHEISVEDPPTVENRITTRKGHKTETHEAFLNDDFGWVLGFSFGIPVFLMVVIFVFFIGDLRSLFDNLFFGVIGALIGAIMGVILYNFVKSYHMKRLRLQEKKGGYRLWITVNPTTPVDEVLDILKRWGARNIEKI